MASEPVPAMIPDGEVVYAIGDIHGRSDLLFELLHLIEQDAAHTQPHARKTLIFLGDYVDRGPDSRGVIEMLCNGLPHDFEAVFLKGNHEEILLGFLDDPTLLGSWCRNGGERTLRSYGVDCGRIAWARTRSLRPGAMLASALPQAHLNFLRRLRLTCEPANTRSCTRACGAGRAARRKTQPISRRRLRDAEFLTSLQPFGARCKINAVFTVMRRAGAAPAWGRTGINWTMRCAFPVLPRRAPRHCAPCTPWSGIFCRREV